MERRKKIAREKVLEAAAEKDLEVDITDIYPEDKGWKSSVLASSISLFCFSVIICRCTKLRSMTVDSRYQP